MFKEIMERDLQSAERHASVKKPCYDIFVALA